MTEKRRTYVYCRPDFEAEPGPVLAGIIRTMPPKSVLSVPDVTHVARNWPELRALIETLTAKFIRLRPRSVAGSPGEAWEVRCKRDLKRAATARAKARDAYKNCRGRERKHDYSVVHSLLRDGKSVDEIRKQTDLARSVIYYIRDKAA